ncbi:MAG TPA: hypothetical protein VJ809_17220, partial [Pirellulales bacterium]|nr:hypothetical protein [Pirellulales bacterium]
NSDFLRTEYPQPTKRQESSLLSTSAKNEKAYPQTTSDSSLSNRAAEYLRICPCTGFPPETASFVCFVLRGDRSANLHSQEPPGFLATDGFFKKQYREQLDRSVDWQYIATLATH